MLKKIALFGVACVAGLSSAGQVMAQQIEEVVVTAQKRTEAARDVPIAINAFSQQQLEAAAVRSVADLQTLAPSLLVSTANPPSFGSSFRIRGVGTAGNNAGFEGAVGFFLDGVYRSRSGTGLNDIVDMDHVEVLRGPQGTLFGKNTSAGAITVATRAPKLGETSGWASLDLGNYDARRLSGAINVPVSDLAAARLSGVYFRRDGFLKDVVTGDRYEDRDRYALRGQFLFEPTPDLSVRFITDYAQGAESCCQALRVRNGPTAPTIAALAAQNGKVLIDPPRPSAFETSINGPSVNNWRDVGAQMEVSLDLGFATLTSISAHRLYRERNFGDVDFTAADILDRNTLFRSELTTQEVRLNGLADVAAGLDWLVGGFLARENVLRDNAFIWQPQSGAYINAIFRLPASGFPAGTGSFERFGQVGETHAVFGHATLRLTEQFRAVAGLRYNHEEKHGYGLINPNNPGRALPVLGVQNDFSADTTENEWTGSFSLLYSLTPDISAYATYAHGYKAGGINLDRGAAGTPATGVLDPTFGPEFSDNYEAGLKADLFERRARLNLTVFRTEFTDFQLNAFNGLRFTITNVSGLVSQGAEADVTVAVGAGLTLNAALNYTDAKYNDDVGPSVSGGVRLGGNQINNAPKWTSSLGADWKHELAGSGLQLTAHADALYRSSYNAAADLSPLKEQDGFWLFNLRAGVAAPDERWAVTVWCRNCADEYYANSIFDSVLQTGSLDAWVTNPREWGVTLSVKY